VNKAVKTVVFWAVIVISAMLLFQVVKAKPAEQSTPQISYSQFMAAVESGDVVKVTIAGNRIRGQYRNNGVFWLSGQRTNPCSWICSATRVSRFGSRTPGQTAGLCNCWEPGLPCCCLALFGFS
jgi:ATP-dependent Zn protease